VGEPFYVLNADAPLHEPLQELAVRGIGHDLAQVGSYPRLRASAWLDRDQWASSDIELS
jgi:hypothetical protein